MMRLSREERLGLAMAVENSGQEVNLHEKDRKLLRKISKYIQTFPLSEYEIEEIRKELIGISSQAELRGETLQEAIGVNYKEFSNELIKAIADIEPPKRWGILRVTGTLMMIEGGMQLLCAAIYLLSILIMWTMEISIAQQAFGLPDYSVYYFFGESLIMGIIFFYGGKKGRYQCGDARAARQCVVIGITAFLLVLLFLVSDAITMVQIWKSGTIAEMFSADIVINLIIIFTVLFLYTSAAKVNMNGGKEGA